MNERNETMCAQDSQSGLCLGAAESPPVKPPSPIPYTLRLGVTGHRHLQDTTAVQAAIKTLIRRLQAALGAAAAGEPVPLTLGQTRWRHFENLLAWRSKRILAALGLLPKRPPLKPEEAIRWRIVSGLAQGADCIVAAAAREQLNAELEAVLPFDPGDFRKDFDSSASLQDFDRLFAAAKWIVRTDIPHWTQLPANPAPERPAGYRRVGEQVVNTCEILLAVWDGQPAGGPGGTAEVVKLALELNRPVIWIDARQPAKPPCLLRGLDREGLPEAADPLPELATEWSPNYVQLVEYNRDPAFKPAAFQQCLNENKRRLLQVAQDSQLSQERLFPVLEAILPHYARADQLALHYQKRHIQSASWLYWLAAIAVTVTVVQALFFPEAAAWILLEIAALVVAVGWYRVSLCESWHERWLHYRHLAERFRALMFTGLLKPGNAAQSAATEPTLPFYPGPGGWVVAAFDHLVQQIPASAAPSGELPGLRKFLLAGWIADQAGYHARNAGRKHKAARRAHLLVGWMLVVTLVAACLHWLKVTEYPPLEHLITAAAIVLPALAAALHAIGGIRDYERIAARSSRMAELLKDIQRSIQDAPTEADLRREIGRAENLMATESHEWCVSLSFRRLSLPV